MNRLQKFEKVIINLSWIFIVFLILSLVIKIIFKVDIRDGLVGQHTLIKSFVLVLLVFNFTKLKIVNNSVIYTDKVFDIFRIVEVVLFSFFMSNFYCDIEYIIILFPVILCSLCKGKKDSILLLGLSFLIKFSYFVINSLLIHQGNIDMHNIVNTFFRIIWVYLILMAITLISSRFNEDSERNKKENARLVIELGEKYEQLEAAQNEIKNQYDKLKESNHKLEDTNIRLTSSIAEFYTLQQISEAIGSIFDISELLKFVNDVILGVMGVNYSTIVLFDSDKKRLKVQFTNIQNKNDLSILSDNINCKVLLDVLENEKPLLENMVDPKKYEFIQNRKIGSFICIPLSSKSRKFGLTLIEHKNNNTFNSENLRLLKTIGKQVSMAIENAELYANMQELATIDGLTGVYNRVYFHQKYEKEFKAAKDLGYELCLVILDIDFFKKFNDTYGHLFGDVVLKSVAQTVKNNLRPEDTIARFGGEEFVLMMPKTSIKEAFDKVEALRIKIANNIVKDNVISASVTASFGIACYPETSGNKIELIRDADNALYKAKYSGRNCTKIATFGNE